MSKKVAGADAPPRKSEVVRYMPDFTQCPECTAEGHLNPRSEVICFSTQPNGIHHMQCKRCRELIDRAPKSLPSLVHPGEARSFRFKAVDAKTAEDYAAEMARRERREAEMEVTHTTVVRESADAALKRAQTTADDARRAHERAAKHMQEIERAGDNPR